MSALAPVGGAGEASQASGDAAQDRTAYGFELASSFASAAMARISMPAGK